MYPRMTMWLPVLNVVILKMQFVSLACLTHKVPCCGSCWPCNHYWMPVWHMTLIPILPHSSIVHRIREHLNHYKITSRCFSFNLERQTKRSQESGWQQRSTRWYDQEARDWGEVPRLRTVSFAHHWNIEVVVPLSPLPYYWHAVCPFAALLWLSIPCNCDPQMKVQPSSTR